MVDVPELPGCDSSENLLTTFLSQTRKPGRPPKIADEMLARIRDELLFVLEENWALVGWELRQAENASDLRTAFLRIKNVNCRSIELFCLNYPRETTFAKLEAAHKRLEECSLKLREAHFECEKLRVSAEYAKSAVRMTSSAQKCKELRPMCEETENALKMAETTVNQLRARWNRLDSAVRQRGASFAQSELLDFIRSDRYASSPLTFANAMAGLPAIHWRQSVDRCLRFQSRASHGLTYRQFQIVAETLTHPPTNAEEAVQRMKTRLLRAKGPDVKQCNALAENWYFLRCAIGTAFRELRPAENALPYRIFAEYQRLSSSRSPLDLLLAEREIIETPAYVKERLRIGRP